jgi:hypothetical protein
MFHWESFWEETDYYEEYEDDFDIDSVSSMFGSENTHVDIYRRYKPKSSEVTEDDYIEIAPISLCHGQNALDAIVVCQRRANYLKPARANILGLNIIRLKKEWLSKINADNEEKIFIYANVSRNLLPENHQNNKLSLFMPWLYPTNSTVSGIVNNWNDDTVFIKIKNNNDKDFFNHINCKVEEISGQLKSCAINTNDLKKGMTLTLSVIGYDKDNSGKPVLLLDQYKSQKNNFQTFAKQFKKGNAINVKMERILKDPLGRSPIFIVQEQESGLSIPMSDSDFCGNTFSRSYFGERFEIGEIFQVDIEDILDNDQEVYLTRMKYLLDEYDGISREFDRRIIQVEIRRFDQTGVYLNIKSKKGYYVGFVRRSLWPSGFKPKIGNRIKARLRFYERNIKMKKLHQLLEDGDALPPELDLGIELDLRIPPAYERFKKRYPIGAILTVTIDKQLDNGGLLVGLPEEGLKGIVYDSELGLSANGLLKKARDYTPGDSVDLIVTRLKDDTANVECSIFRVTANPSDIQKGDSIDVRVLLIRSNLSQPMIKYITCSFNDKHRIDVRADLVELPFQVNDMINVTVDLTNHFNSYIRANYVKC